MSTAPSRDDGESKDGDGHILAERALSVVVANEENHAIAERDALLARIAELEKENQELRGEGGPEDGRFAIATYRIEQRFLIPDDATSYYIKWGKLHYRTADDSDSESVEAFNGYNEGDIETFKRPDAIRYTDEDEYGLWADRWDQLWGEDSVRTTGPPRSPPRRNVP